MKRYQIIAAAILLAACGKEENTIPVPENDGTMKFEVLHPGTKATETSFEEGDRIGLYVVEYDGDIACPLQISGNWANNVPTVLNSGIWTPEKKIYWSENKVDVYSYYPYMQLSSVDEQKFAVELDQTTLKDGENLGGYEASDFLWAKAEGKQQEDETVALQFRHCMSKLVVRLEKGPDYEGEFPDNATMYVHNTVTDARLDLVNGVALKDPMGTPETITMRKVDNATYEAIIVPQRIETRRPLLELISGSVSYLVESSFNFKSGMMHTITLTINSNPEQVEIEIGGSVGGGWN